MAGDERGSVNPSREKTGNLGEILDHDKVEPVIINGFPTMQMRTGINSSDCQHLIALSYIPNADYTGGNISVQVKSAGPNGTYDGRRFAIVAKQEIIGEGNYRRQFERLFEVVPLELTTYVLERLHRVMEQPPPDMKWLEFSAFKDS